MPTGSCRADSQTDWPKQMDQKDSVGKLETLNAGGQDFLSIYTEQTSKTSKGQIIILHDHLQHPNWNDLIQPVRTKFPNHGWSTLSIELPKANKEAGDKEFSQLPGQSTSRILAAQAMLQGKNATKIIVIAYGLGARMAIEWLSKTPQPPIAALIIISMADGDKGSGLDSNTDLIKIKIPVLDIIAENDARQVLTAAKERYEQRSKMQKYRQMEIIAADHFYNQHEDELIKRIRGWLKVTFKTEKKQE